MSAGVMIELYRQMSDISLFFFLNNSLPKIKQYLYENIDPFHSVEEAVALAERYEVGHSDGAISKFSISAFAQHLNHHNYSNTEQTLSSEMADETQEELNYQYGDNQYDGLINAVGGNVLRGGRRNTWPWGRGGGLGGGNISRLPFSVNSESSNRLARNNESNDYAAQKAQGLCFCCGSSAHVVKQCPYATVPSHKPKHFTSSNRSRGKFKTFQRREKLYSLGVFLGTGDVPVIYYTDTDGIEELPDTSHDDNTEEYEGNEINVMNKNSY